MHSLRKKREGQPLKCPLVMAGKNCLKISCTICTHINQYLTLNLERDLNALCFKSRAGKSEMPSTSGLMLSPHCGLEQRGGRVFRTSSLPFCNITFFLLSQFSPSLFRKVALSSSSCLMTWFSHITNLSGWKGWGGAYFHTHTYLSVHSSTSTDHFRVIRQISRWHQTFLPSHLEGVTQKFCKTFPFFLLPWFHCHKPPY